MIIQVNGTPINPLKASKKRGSYNVKLSGTKIASLSKEQIEMIKKERKSKSLITLQNYRTISIPKENYDDYKALVKQLNLTNKSVMRLVISVLQSITHITTPIANVSVIGSSSTEEGGEICLNVK